MSDVLGNFSRGRRQGGDSGQTLLSVMSLIMDQSLRQERLDETKRHNLAIEQANKTRLNALVQGRLGEVQRLIQGRETLRETEELASRGQALVAKTQERQKQTQERQKVEGRRVESLRSRESSTLSMNFRNLYSEAEAFQDKAEQFPSIGPSGISILSRTNWNDRKKAQIKTLAKQRVLEGFDLRAAGFDVDIIGPFLTKSEFTEAFRKVEGINPTPQEVEQLRGVYWE